MFGADLPLAGDITVRPTPFLNPGFRRGSVFELDISKI
jgi:hypothetical protein